ncbi:MAG: guanylate kinase [Chloroflexi bacterium]|nr:guanylate kinase [Chloroflexota bacterium]
MTTRMGTLFIFSGPSGAGKDSVLDELKKVEPTIHYVVSFTSRSPRNLEENGRDYFFVTSDEMRSLWETGKLLECTEYIPGRLYGIPREPVDSHLRAGLDVLIKPEVRGAAKIRALYPDAVSIFLAPPSVAEAVRRVELRNKDPLADRSERFRVIQSEMAAAPTFDYYVTNETGRLEETVQRVRAIIAEARSRRNPAC